MVLKSKLIRCIKIFMMLQVLCISFAHTENESVGTEWTAQAHHTFSGGNNIITDKAIMRNGFTLQDSATSCSFSSFFPVSGSVNLNDGRLDLLENFVVDKINPLFIPQMKVNENET